MLAQSKLYGLPDGVYYCQQERTQQLNERIANRNIPSAFLEPQFSTTCTNKIYSFTYNG